MKFVLTILLLVSSCCVSAPALFAAHGDDSVGSGTVSGRVTNARGKGIEGARVVATAAGGTTERQATCDAKGNFRIDLAPGKYRFDFEADGYANTSLREQVAVEAGRTTKISEKIALPAAEQGSVVRGSVFTETGRSLAGARVVLERVSTDGTTIAKAKRLESTSDRMGVFAFTIDQPGEARFRVTASKSGFAESSTLVDVAGNETTNIVLRLAPAGAKP